MPVDATQSCAYKLLYKKAPLRPCVAADVRNPPTQSRTVVPCRAFAMGPLFRQPSPHEERPDSVRGRGQRRLRLEYGRLRCVLTHSVRAPSFSFFFSGSEWHALLGGWAGVRGRGFGGACVSLAGLALRRRATSGAGPVVCDVASAWAPFHRNS